MEYLFSVFWKNIRIGIVGQRNNKYIYVYDLNGLNSAKEYGFDILIGFPDINKVYINDDLFPVFESRIISTKRRIFNGIKDKIDFLIKTNGILVTDNISIKYEGDENKKDGKIRI